MTIKWKKEKSPRVKEKFPLKATTKQEWLRIVTLPATEPITSCNFYWKDILPKEVEILAPVLEKIVDSPHPFVHQQEAIEYLLEPQEKTKDLIINGGTYSGKSLSFSVPGIVKLMTGETDFIVLFYPSKQLLMDQFERMKELVVEIEKQTVVRLTTRMYSGDTGKSSVSGKTIQKKEL